MCASTAYFRRGGEDEKLLEDVAYVRPKDTGFQLMGILGDERVVENARILEIDLESHRIILGPAGE